MFLKIPWDFFSHKKSWRKIPWEKPKFPWDNEKSHGKLQKSHGNPNFANKVHSEENAFNKQK